MSPIRGIDDRLAVDWAPILAACADMAGFICEPDATALGGALGRLLDTIPGEVLELHLASRNRQSEGVS